MDITALLTALGQVAKMVTDLVASHEKALAEKQKEIESLKKVVEQLKPPPK